MQNCRQSPGLGSAMWRTWYSRSKRSFLDPVGVVELERYAQQLLAEDGDRCSRLSMYLSRPLNRTRPPGAVDGS